jgi:hypothetical protein
MKFRVFLNERAERFLKSSDLKAKGRLKDRLKEQEFPGPSSHLLIT